MLYANNNLGDMHLTAETRKRYMQMCRPFLSLDFFCYTQVGNVELTIPKGFHFLLEIGFELTVIT